MIWALGLIAPFLVFAALIGLRTKAKSRALHLIQAESERRDNAHPAAPPEAPEAVTRAAPVAEDNWSAFDRLRGAMGSGDASLFAPLQIALVELVRVGRTLEVRTPFLTKRILHPNEHNKSLYATEHEFTALEVRLRSFEAVAGVSTAAVVAASADKDLQKLLHAIGV